MPTAAQIVARALYDAGCRHAFGVPGGEVLALMAALDEAGVGFHLCKHENSGGFMAEGVHHADGAPGVLLTTIGPGVANAVNTVANALQDQTPMIVLSGCVDPADATTYTHQVFDHGALLRPVVKASFVATAGAVGTMIERAVRIATAAPPGPVHIDMPIGLADQGLEEPPTPMVLAEPAMAPTAGPALDAARARLAAAVRPIVIAGVGAVADEAGPLIQEICERFGAPLITTYKAKGIVPEHHPLALGGHGLSPRSDREVLPLVARADLVLCVGYDPIEMRAGWRAPWAPERAIEFAQDQNRHGMHGAELSFIGDVREGLAALAAGVAPKAATWPDGEPAHVRARLQERFGDRDHWGPHQAFAAARRASPRGTVVTVDSGAHRILLSQMWRADGPRGVLQSTALCTMGCALPLAIGRKLADPEAPVLAVMGDAGLEMVLGELATLRDLRLSVVIMVMVDRALALIELKQRATNRAQLGVRFGATDFVAVAEAMGGVGVAVSDARSLETALGEGYAREGFTLIACEISPDAYEGAF